ncbi:hypothetical protein TNCV_4900451 [Trichonephila clavipes]|nr:hypothetical protein TNCV_4900451 [Trichonephila clavipes]
MSVAFIQPLSKGEPQQKENIDKESSYIGEKGLGSNPGEVMDVCKCIVPARHGGTLNSHRATSPLVRLVEREDRWETSDHSQSVLL